MEKSSYQIFFLVFLCFFFWHQLKEHFSAPLPKHTKDDTRYEMLSNPASLKTTKANAQLPLTLP